MADESLWPDWNRFQRVLSGREVVLFGCSEWAEKTHRKMDYSPLAILDNSQQMQELGVYDGLSVRTPDAFLNTEGERPLVVITTGSFQSAIDELVARGMEAGRDFIMSPVLRNQKIEQDIKALEQELIVLCSDIPVPDSSHSGGGIYTYNTRTGSLEKQASGKFHQMVEWRGRYYISDEFEGIRIFDANWQEEGVLPALPGGYIHGLTLREADGTLFVANPRRDSVSVMNADTGEHLDELPISTENPPGVSDRHHINDLVFYDDKLFISMFSESGLWRRGCYDGAVACMEPDRGVITGFPVRDKWMPHSVRFINGEIVFAESMTGDIYRNSNKVLCRMSGFARGIAFDGHYYYIGQSEHRYFDRLQDVSRNIHLNCGIHVYDEATHVSRFHSFPQLSNIHDIHIARS